MNIHFKDKELFESLKEATIAKVIVGSHLYGTNNENSDKDYLYIYATSQKELQSFIWTNHQLQYKESAVDHNFVSLHTFIRNCINGDSTINFEVIQSGVLEGTDLDFLHYYKKYFETYTIMRSYLGFARRDCKHWSKGVTDYEKRKRLLHIVRGYLYAYHLINKSFDFQDVHIELLNIMKTLEISMNSVNLYAEKIDLLRKELNEKFENKTLRAPKIMNGESAKILNNLMFLLQNKLHYIKKVDALQDMDMSLFCEAFENWVEY